MKYRERHLRNPRQVRRWPESGFTVVEMIIVLAIAGLILSIVLLAIPALQRSSRNNQRRQDTQSILGAVSHWELNHSGNIPDSTDHYLQDSNTKLSYYNPDPAAGEIIIHTCSGNSCSPATIAPATNLDKIDIYNYQKCSTITPGGSTKIGAGYSDVVALYVIETGSGRSGKCQQL